MMGQLNRPCPMNRSFTSLLAVFTLLILVLCCTAASRERNRVWRNRLILWQDVTRKSPNKARGYNNVGVNYCKGRQLDLAIVNCSKAIELNPRYGDAYLTRGNAYDEAGEPEKAIDDYTKALNINPVDSFTYYNRGVTLSKIGKVNEAIADYEQACKYGTEAGCEAARLAREKRQGRGK